MRNPNSVTFQTRTTSTQFVTEYGFNSVNYANSEYPHFQALYGVSNVSMERTGERKDGRTWIVIGQVLATNDTIRQTIESVRQ
jgi:hypothetical protein